MQPSSTLLFFCSLLHGLETPPVQFQPICLHLLFCTLQKQPCIISIRPQITICTTDPSNVLDLLHQHAVCILYPSPCLYLSMSTLFPRDLSHCHLSLFLLISFTFYLLSLPVFPSLPSTSCCSWGAGLVVSSWHGGMIPYGSAQEMI